MFPGLIPSCPLLAVHHSILVIEDWVGASGWNEVGFGATANHGTVGESNVMFFGPLFRIRWRKHWSFWTNFRKNRG